MLVGDIVAFNEGFNEVSGPCYQWPGYFGSEVEHVAVRSGGCNQNSRLRDSEKVVKDIEL